MKNLLIALFLVLAAACATTKTPQHFKNAEGKPVIIFADKEYQLAFVDTTSNTSTNEYVPVGQTVKQWNTLIAVRLFKGVQHMDRVIPAYLESIKPLLAVKPEIFERSGTDGTSDITLVLFLLAPDKTYFEYNLHRFVKTAEGIKAYQYARKLPFQKQLDVSGILKEQPQLMDMLGACDIPLY